MAGTEGSPDFTLTWGLATAELHLHQGEVGAAEAAAQEALRLALDGGRRLDEARARALLGQCALAQDKPAAAVTHLRAALALQVERGAFLEAARTRLLLAEALVREAAPDLAPHEVATLRGEARAQFAASGVPLPAAPGPARGGG
jgi:hypothetical protein